MKKKDEAPTEPEGGAEESEEQHIIGITWSEWSERWRTASALATLDESYEEVTERHNSTTSGIYTLVEELMGTNHGLSRRPCRVTIAMADVQPLADQMLKTPAELGRELMEQMTSNWCRQYQGEALFQEVDAKGQRKFPIKRTSGSSRKGVVDNQFW